MDNLNNKPKHVLLIDDQPVCRHGLERIFNDIIEFSFDGFASSMEDAIIPIREPDIVAIDIAIANCKGIAAIKDLKRRFSKSVILVITSHDELLFAERCLKAGANGYLMKSASEALLVKAFRDVAHGHLHVSERIRSIILSRISGKKTDIEKLHFDRLSDRELLIVQHISQSKNNQEIAKDLQISTKTIESHRSRIKSKLELGSPSELVRFAMRLQTALF